jgi:hypothetical protein
MGGPGFFELLLDSSRSFSPEHLVLTLWGAADWLLLDGRWVSAHPNQYARQRPMYSAFVEQGRWDEVSPVLVGAVLKSAVVEDDQSKFSFDRLGAEHLLELPRDTNRLPIHEGSQEQRSWCSQESLLDAWVVTSAHLLC